MEALYRFMVSRKDLILRYGVAGLLLIPGAVLLMVPVALGVGLTIEIVNPNSGIFEPPAEPAENSINEIYYLAAWFCWVILLYWATNTDSVKRSASRAFWALTTGIILSPGLGVVLVVFGEPDAPDQIIPKWFYAVMLVIIAAPMAIFTRALAIVTAPVDSPEKTGGVWYVLRPIGGVYLVLAYVLLFVVVIVLR